MNNEREHDIEVLNEFENPNSIANTPVMPVQPTITPVVHEDEVETLDIDINQFSSSNTNLEQKTTKKKKDNSNLIFIGIFIGIILLFIVFLPYIMKLFS